MDNSTNNEHSCVETIAKVVLSLDGDLSQAEEREFLIEVNCCSHCLKRYDIERSFKEFLQQKVSNHKVDPSVIAKIKSEIKSKL